MVIIARPRHGRAIPDAEQREERQQQSAVRDSGGCGHYAGARSHFPGQIALLERGAAIGITTYSIGAESGRTRGGIGAVGEGGPSGSDPGVRGSLTFAALFSAYRQRRIDGLLDYVLDEVNKGLLGAADAPSQPNVLGRRTRDWLKRVAQCRPGLGRAHPQRLCAEGRDLEAAPPSWIWGKYAVEVIASLVLDLLRRTQRLLHVSPESTMDLSLGDIASEMADPTPGGDEGDSYDWDVLDELDSMPCIGLSASR